MEIIKKIKTRIRGAIIGPSPLKEIVKALNNASMRGFLQSPVVFDIGAYRGRFSFFLALKGFFVLAFEPNPYSFKSISRLQNKKVKVFPFAIIDKFLKGKETFLINKSFPVLSCLYRDYLLRGWNEIYKNKKLDFSKTEQIEVNCFTIAKCINSSKQNPPELIIIDSGHNYTNIRLLKSLREVVKQKRPNIIFLPEIENDIDRSRFFKSIKYNCYYCQFKRGFLGGYRFKGLTKSRDLLYLGGKLGVILVKNNSGIEFEY